MKNKRLNMQRLKDKLFRHDSLDQFAQAWAQLEATGEYILEANGGWIFGRTL